MTRPTTVLFVDGSRLALAPGTTALDAVRSLDAGKAHQVEEGSRVITDSRGIQVPADQPVYDGAIFRVVTARPPASAERETPG